MWKNSNNTSCGWVPSDVVINRAVLLPRLDDDWFVAEWNWHNIRQRLRVTRPCFLSWLLPILVSYFLIFCGLWLKQTGNGSLDLEKDSKDQLEGESKKCVCRRNEKTKVRNVRFSLAMKTQMVGALHPQQSTWKWKEQLETEKNRESQVGVMP